MASIEEVRFRRVKDPATGRQVLEPVAKRDRRWRARYRDADGRSRSATFDRKIDAERFLERNGADLQRGDWIDPSLRRTTFDDWADAWWDTTVRLRPVTRRGYWMLLTGHVLPFFGGRRLASIDFMDVESFIAEQLRKGHCPKRVRDAVSVISLIMKGAVRANARKDNPAAGHSIPMHRRKLRPDDVLTMPQVHQLVTHVRDPFKPAVWLLIFTGMRPSELCGLRVRALDLPRKRIYVDESLVCIGKFDDVVAHLDAGPTKTEAADRLIPIPEWVCHDLAGMLQARAGEGRPDPDERLFRGVKGGVLTVDTFRRHVMRPALRAAGLPETLRTYDLRHSHASLLIDRGANVLAVAQRMGHADPNVTLRIYGHLFEGVQEELTAKLDELRSMTEAPGGTLIEMPAAADRRKA
ncbi:MAG: site-specific integrase [Actinobacteria bacterium]|nr:site-specific integrase [Actinomycetota bacterium]